MNFALATFDIAPLINIVETNSYIKLGSLITYRSLHSICKH